MIFTVGMDSRSIELRAKKCEVINTEIKLIYNCYHFLKGCRSIYFVVGIVLARNVLAILVDFSSSLLTLEQLRLHGQLK